MLKVVELQPGIEEAPLMTGEHRMDRKWVVALAFVAAMFMNIMDTTVVNTALPAIARQFHTTPAGADWVVIGYLLSLAVWILASGWLGDHWGTKRVFLTALAIFTGASWLAGLSHTLGQLVLSRLIQGIGGGIMAPVGQAMLYRAFPPAERARASMILTVPMVMAPATGPVIGGFLVDHWSWHWVFYINLPIGLVTWVFSLLRLPEYRAVHKTGFDGAGFLLSALGLLLFVYSLSEGPLVGWAHPQIWLSGVLGIVLLITLFRIERRRAHPLVAVQTLDNHLFRTALAIGFFGRAAFLGILYVMPQFLQEARLLSPLQSGLTTFPEALGVILSTQVVGRLYPRIGPRRLMAAGLLGVALVIAAMTLLNLRSSLWEIRSLMFLLGVGMAYMIMPLQTAAFAQISHDLMGRAAALYNAQLQVSGAMGVALLTTMMTSFGNGAIHQVTPYHLAFKLGAMLAFLGSLGALWIHDRDALNTMTVKSRAS
jgi:EmrB/QacA subfamily drug resistance transporter